MRLSVVYRGHQPPIVAFRQCVHDGIPAFERIFGLDRASAGNQLENAGW
ncbi:MAG: hypothetical protein ACHQ4H_18890 [Ktedonobacterales bacterium]